MSTERSIMSRTLRKGISLLLMICTLATLAPTAFASSVGSTSAAITESFPLPFVRLTSNVTLFHFQNEASPVYGSVKDTVSVTAGTVLMMPTTNTFTITSGGTYEYACVYYNNVQYNVLASSLPSALSSSDVVSYVTGTLWTASNFVSMKVEYGLKRDVSVYGLQMALQTLGYYSDTLDGSYGDATSAAVKKFQKDYKLDVDGYAGPYTQKVIYPLASSSYTSSGTTVGTQVGTLTTTANVNLRKSASSKAVKKAVVPKNTTLAYTKTTTSGGITWYYVTFGKYTGWIMGTYVSTSGSSGGGSSGGVESNLGTVTITLKNTRVRKTANGTKSGYVLAKGTTATLLATPTSAGGYTWYYIKTSTGIKGYVRGDCATVSYDGGGGVTPSTSKTYIRITSDAGVPLFTSEEVSSAGAVTVPKGTVLQMVSTNTYTKNGQVYCSLYYNNKRYNCLYANVSADIMSAAALTTYMTGTIWPAGFSAAGTLKEPLNLIGSVYVHSLQYALTLLGYYTGTLDGNFGTATTSAVRNFQKAYKQTVDGSVGPETSATLYPAAIAALTGGTTTGDFGTVSAVKLGAWVFGDSGGALFPKYTTAKVMDLATKRVFSIYRWYGKNHADCVPSTAADTKIMCDIIGFPFNSSHPSSAQLSQIISGSGIWPDFKGTWTTKTWNSGAWDRRAALINIGGTVYPVSIYGWPHGYDGKDSICRFANTNNYYGMLCVHFNGSKTHVGDANDAQHMADISEAYSYAKSRWPSLVKN